MTEVDEDDERDALWSTLGHKLWFCTNSPETSSYWDSMPLFCTRLAFDVKAAHSAHIALSDRRIPTLMTHNRSLSITQQAQHTNPTSCSGSRGRGPDNQSAMYEIVIALSNEYSAIRHGSVELVNDQRTKVRSELVEDEWRGFIINFSEGSIKVRRHNEEEPFLHCPCDANFKPSFVAFHVGIGGGNGIWRFYNPCGEPHLKGLLSASTSHQSSQMPTLKLQVQPHMSSSKPWTHTPYRLGIAATHRQRCKEGIAPNIHDSIRCGPQVQRSPTHRKVMDSARAPWNETTGILARFEAPNGSGGTRAEMQPLETQPLATPRRSKSSNESLRTMRRMQSSPGVYCAPTTTQENAFSWVTSVRPCEPLLLGKQLMFFASIQRRMAHNYIVVLDRSASMAKLSQTSTETKAGITLRTPWHEAREALRIIARAVCAANPDGLAIFLFGNEYVEFSRCRSASDVEGPFEVHTPVGGMNLWPVLLEVVEGHRAKYARSRTPTSVLIMQAGEPDDAEDVVQLMIDTANSIASDDEIFFSFIQCGQDVGATRFLEGLDLRLRCKRDIVDTMKCSFMRTKGFAETIKGLLGTIQFFSFILRREEYNYVIVVDRSASMSLSSFPSQTRWAEAKKALEIIAPAVCSANPSGPDVYLFNDDYVHYTKCRLPSDIKGLFEEYITEGDPNLHLVLSRAIEEAKATYAHSSCPTAILIIHAGEPDQPEKVKQLLKDTANSSRTSDEIFFSFIQCGEDVEGTRFLDELDLGLYATYEKADVMKYHMLQREGFAASIAGMLREAIGVSRSVPMGVSAMKQVLTQHHGLATKSLHLKTTSQQLRFFACIRQRMAHRYVIILDKSRAMTKFASQNHTRSSGELLTRWHDAEEALKIIAPSICAANSCGATAYVYSNDYAKFCGVQTAKDVEALFKTCNPTGGANLCPVLCDVIQRHREDYARNQTPTSVLVVHGAEPDDAEKVMHLLIDTANFVASDDEIFFSFIQCGEDLLSNRFIDHLQSRPKCKHDIVDTLKYSSLHKESFAFSIVGLLGTGQFFAFIQQRAECNYVIVLDRSASMGLSVSPGVMYETRWHQAETALKVIAPAVRSVNPIGCDLYLFNDDYVHYTKCKSISDVECVFRLYSPEGAPNMYPVLSAIVENAKATYGRSQRPTAVLIIHAGEPPEREHFQRPLKDAANALEASNEIFFSFMQVGQDTGVARLPRAFDQGLNDRCDIVDSMPQCMKDFAASTVDVPERATGSPSAEAAVSAMTHVAIRRSHVVDDPRQRNGCVESIESLFADGTKEFFNVIHQRVPQNYVIILDRSGFMGFGDSLDAPSTTRWHEAEKALKLIAPAVCSASPNGSVIYLFGDEYMKHAECKSTSDIEGLFVRYSPEGLPRLLPVLSAVVEEAKQTYAEDARPTAILIILAGRPHEADTVLQLLQDTATSALGEVVFTFMQCGRDAEVARFLENLQRVVKGKCGDVVDVVEHSTVDRKCFALSTVGPETAQRMTESEISSNSLELVNTRASMASETAPGMTESEISSSNSHFDSVTRSSAKMTKSSQQLRFFASVQQQLPHTYIVVLDTSCCMTKGTHSGHAWIGPAITPWQDAAKALKIIAPAVCTANPDGMTVHLSNDGDVECCRCRSASDVELLFERGIPDGGTSLWPALLEVVEGHRAKYARSRTPTSVLIMQAGEPDDAEDVVQLMIDTANSIASDDEIFFSFIQCGQDVGATRFLEGLDLRLRCKRDIVDTMKCSFMRTKGFAETIKGLLGTIQFFSFILRREEYNYVIVVDRSASMSLSSFPSQTRWAEAKKALEIIAPAVCSANPSGPDVYLFNDDYVHYTKCRLPSDIKGLFEEYIPEGDPNLLPVLLTVVEQANLAHAKNHRPTAVLVIHAAKPNNPDSVQQFVEDTADSLWPSEVVFFSFLQCGEDATGTDFLDDLDQLNAKYDIVDTMRYCVVQRKGFTSSLAGTLRAALDWAGSPHTGGCEVSPRKHLTFFASVQQQMERRYIIILHLSRAPKRAQKALKIITPAVVAANPDGATVFFLSGDQLESHRCQFASDVDTVFSKYSPSGSSNLHIVLKAVIDEHQEQHARTHTPTSVLIMHDGEPDDAADVQQLLTDAGNSVAPENEISFSFMQCGNDAGGTGFLDRLDSELQCKHRIVDTMKYALLQKTGFTNTLKRLLGKNQFFELIKQRVPQDYVILLDRSVNMHFVESTGTVTTTRWHEAEKALKLIAPAVCSASPNGSVIYLFGDEYMKHAECKSTSDIEGLFVRYSPEGLPRLLPVLSAVVEEAKQTYAEDARPTAILIILAGRPHEADTVLQLLQDTATSALGEVVFTFMQCGRDAEVARFLENLQRVVKGKCGDVVDVVEHSTVDRQGFAASIAGMLGAAAYASPLRQAGTSRTARIMSEPILKRTPTAAIQRCSSASVWRSNSLAAGVNEHGMPEATFSKRVHRTKTKGQLRFFASVQQRLAHTYMIILDTSRSMKKRRKSRKAGSPLTRWQEAAEALKILAPAVCTANPDGSTVYLLSSPVWKCHSAADVERQFRKYTPTGGTSLHTVVSKVVEAHWDTYARSRRPTSVLVLQGDEPDNAEGVKEVLKKTANSVSSDHEIFFSFMQCGDDAGAAHFLDQLDSGLKCKRDIVDTMNYSFTQEKDFAACVAGLVGTIRFFSFIKQREFYNYAIVLDRSGSMGLCNSARAASESRWHEAEQALKVIVPAICRGNPNGSDVYLFNDEYVHYTKCKHASDVEALFRLYSPEGNPNLLPVLSSIVAAAKEAYAQNHSPTAILIVLAGAPQDAVRLQELLKDTVISLRASEEIFFSFLQCGTNTETSGILDTLDLGLKGKYDVVDAMKYCVVESMGFAPSIAGLLGVEAHDSPLRQIETSTISPSAATPPSPCRQTMASRRTESPASIASMLAVDTSCASSPTGKPPLPRLLLQQQSGRNDGQGTSRKPAFFAAAQQRRAHRYIIVLDQRNYNPSSLDCLQSTIPTQWREAEQALKIIAPALVAANPDGATVCFLSGDQLESHRCQFASDVDTVFSKYSPSGSSNLHIVLKAVIDEHQEQHARTHTPTSVLIMHDGEPDDAADVQQLLTDAGNSVASENEISFSFMQCGNDAGGTGFLDRLDSELQCKHRIVDTMKYALLQKTGFADAVERSTNRSCSFIDVSPSTPVSEMTQVLVQHASPRARSARLGNHVADDRQTAADAHAMFFTSIKQRKAHTYVILLDKSGSMTKWASRSTRTGSILTRWQEAEEALKIIAPAVCTVNPDGATVYLFSNDFFKSKCLSAWDVEGLFKKHHPNGGTNLAPVIQKVIAAHRKEYAHSQTPTSVLIMHDGAPDNAGDVKRLLTDMGNSVSSEDEIYFTFVQCGQDAGAARFLDQLDSGLKCRYDIVDTVKYAVLQKKGFAETIAGMLGTIQFFSFIQRRSMHNYVILVSNTKSMTFMEARGMTSRTRWFEVEKALKVLVPAVCSASPNGPDLYLFNNDYVKHKCRSVSDVESLFASRAPEGAPHLHVVLSAVVGEARRTYAQTHHATAVLIIHDGLPTYPERVKQVIRDTANSARDPDEIFFSFIQCAEDAAANGFLDELDFGLNAKYDVVDVLHYSVMHRKGFAASIADMVRSGARRSSSRNGSYSSPLSSRSRGSNSSQMMGLQQSIRRSSSRSSQGMLAPSLLNSRSGSLHRGSAHWSDPTTLVHRHRKSSNGLRSTTTPPVPQARSTTPQPARVSSTSPPPPEDTHTAAHAQLGFLTSIKRRMGHAYVILVDKSGSMTKWAQKSRKRKNGSLQTRWQEAEAALKIIAPAVCTANPDGAAMYLFSDDFVKCPRCQSAAEVEKLFRKYTPTGGSRLYPILLNIIEGHREQYSRTKQPTSVLIMHDGEPDSAADVKKLLTETGNAVASTNEIFFSFMQCGDDAGATRFLDQLDSGLPCKHDIVDTMKYSSLQGKDFAVTIERMLGTVQFFTFLQQRASYNYTIVLNRSESMGLNESSIAASNTRWSEAEKALKVLVPAVCQVNSDGPSLYLSGTEYARHTNCRFASDVEGLFRQYSPEGVPKLHPVLSAVIEEARRTYAQNRRPSAVLIIHDELPYEPDRVKQLMKDAANSIVAPGEIFFSFIQCGEDAAASGFLDELDFGLKAKYDIVDALHYSVMQRKGFAVSVADMLRAGQCSSWNGAMSSGGSSASLSSPRHVLHLSEKTLFSQALEVHPHPLK